MASNIVFSGSLLFLSLADVFQLLGGNNCTGILTLKNPASPEKAFVYFVKGNPVNAFWGDLKGLKAVYALFGWTDGKYEFSEEDLSWVEPVIQQNLMELVMDAVRLLDDGEIARIGPGPLDEKDMEETGPDGKKMDFMHPIKGPAVDYRYVTIERNYTDGAIIVREGSYGKWLWVISEGTVRIIKDTSKGPITLARLGEGCFIGTISSFIYGEYERSATVIAEGNVQLCILDGESLHREYSALSENFKKVLLGMDKRLRLINQIALEAFTGEYQTRLQTDRVSGAAFQNNTDLYLIRRGTADIIGKGPSGDVKLFSLGDGDVFGKIPFMAFGHEPISAVVMTSEDFDAELIDSHLLQNEYEKLSPTFKNFVISSATNISMTTKLFYQLLGQGPS